MVYLDKYLDIILKKKLKLYPSSSKQSEQNKSFPIIFTLIVPLKLIYDYTPKPHTALETLSHPLSIKV